MIAGGSSANPAGPPWLAPAQELSQQPIFSGTDVRALFDEPRDGIDSTDANRASVGPVLKDVADPYLLGTPIAGA